MEKKPILQLLPAPRQIQYLEGDFPLTSDGLILLEGSHPQSLRTSAVRFQSALQKNAKCVWSLTSSPAVPANQVSLTLRMAPAAPVPSQGYDLWITPSGVRVQAQDEAGLFYGVCTLIQILEQSGDSLPGMHVMDWPDFPVRGVMLDVSRDKVPTMDTLYDLVDMLAGWKINQLQLYTEHTFAYQRHPLVWEKASPLTGEEILTLDAYCQERYIELVPNQNSFGHLNCWLKHPEYAHLAEVVSGFDAPWGKMEGAYSLCPVDPLSLNLVSEMYDELLPHFTSRMVNVGCDETFDLGQGRSREQVEALGTGQVYLNYLLKIYTNLRLRGYTMQFWGDIVLAHPELIPQLPKDVIALNWGYEASHPFEKEASQFATAGIPFYVCPGTSTWSSVAGRSDNALSNLLNAAENGLKYGAIGYLNTDWGDNGHWQPLPTSYLGFAAGAAYSWALEANRPVDIPDALNRYAFRDRAGVMGSVAYLLGNVYRAAGVEWANASVFSSILQRPLDQVGSHKKIQTIDFDYVLQVIDGAIDKLPAADMDRLDAGLVVNEFRLAAHMLRHACWRGKLAVHMHQIGSTTANASELSRLDADWLSIQADFEQIWLARNRLGGLNDSLARFEKSRRAYLPTQISAS